MFALPLHGERSRQGYAQSCQASLLALLASPAHGAATVYARGYAALRGPLGISGGGETAMSERERRVGLHMKGPLSDTLDGWHGTGSEGEAVAMVNVISSVCPPRTQVKSVIWRRYCHVVDVQPSENVTEELTRRDVRTSPVPKPQRPGCMPLVSLARSCGNGGA